MRKISNVVIVVICVMFSVSGQTRTDRGQHLEASAKLQMDAAAIDVASYPRTSYSYPVEDFKPGVVRVGPRTTYLKEGLRTDEVVKLLGKPVSISERNADGLVVTIYAFQRGEGRILIAEFLGGVLVRSWIETRDEQVVKADR
jgi:hypothetical protein